MANGFPGTLRAAKTPDQDKVTFTAAVDLQAAASDGSAGSLRRFKLDAYNGGPMNFLWSEAPVVVDLAGLKADKQQRPILRDHDMSAIVGHSEKITNTGTSLVIEGVVSGGGDAAAAVVASADNGFPWEASIGTTIEGITEIRAGETAEVNGRTMPGPLTIVSKSSLRETSFVPLGADDTTAARLVANRQHKQKEPKMNPEFIKWLKENDFDPKAVEANDRQKAKLEAQWKSETEEPAQPDPDVPDPDVPDPVADLTARAALEAERIAMVQRETKDHPELTAKAISEKWDENRVKLEALRADRNVNINTGAGTDPSITNQVLEAALCTAIKMPEPEKHFDERTLDAVHKRYRQPISLQELIMEAALANGYVGARSFRQDPRGIMRAAFGLEAGFSTIDISGILGNTANKSLLEGFNGVESGWRTITAIKPVNNFHTHTRYRLTGDLKYEKVAAGGEIPHGDVAELSYTNKADTYARMMAISRHDIINDDLGALDEIPRKLGRGAALQLNTVFWTEFLADAGTFYTSGRGNYNTGAGSALGSAGLGAAITDFRDQTDADSNPLGVEPRIIVVPPALEATLLELIRSVTVNTGGSATTTQVPNANIYAGRFVPVVSSYLTSDSATAWYLLADPRDLAMIETVFLNGQETPVVETADADFNVLGIQFRGYHDFGVNKQEYRAAVKNAGA